MNYGANIIRNDLPRCVHNAHRAGSQGPSPRAASCAGRGGPPVPWLVPCTLTFDQRGGCAGGSWLGPGRSMRGGCRPSWRITGLPALDGQVLRAAREDPERSREVPRGPERTPRGSREDPREDPERTTRGPREGPREDPERTPRGLRGWTRGNPALTDDTSASHVHLHTPHMHLLHWHTQHSHT